MINALALNLADVMDWDTEEATKEYAWLRLMSAVKYDGYSDFRVGLRFLENLATWLRQFQPADRSAAYLFTRRGSSASHRPRCSGSSRSLSPRW